MMAAPGQLLSGCALPRVSDNTKVDLGELLSAPVTTLVIFGTYPSDFNMIEYAQKVRHYWPQLKAKGVDSGLIVVNGSPDSCKRLAEILDLPLGTVMNRIFRARKRLRTAFENLGGEC